YALFGDVMENAGELPERLRILRDRSTPEIAAALGRPTRVGRVQIGDDEWLRITYLMERCPSPASARNSDAWKAGWRDRPNLVFRNRRVSTLADFHARTGVDKLAVPPMSLSFVPTSHFP